MYYVEGQSCLFNREESSYFVLCKHPLCEVTIRKDVLEARNGMIREFMRNVEEGSMEEEGEEEKGVEEEEVRGGRMGDKAGTVKYLLV